MITAAWVSPSGQLRADIRHQLSDINGCLVRVALRPLRQRARERTAQAVFPFHDTHSLSLPLFVCGSEDDATDTLMGLEATDILMGLEICT